MTDEGMTNEKAIKIFNTVLLFGKCDCPKEEIEECLRIAIKALEQEPCEDAISRQAVLDIAKTSKSNWIDNSVLFKKVNNLPPVTPQPKTGHWIDIMVGDMPAQACDRCNTFYPLAYTGGGHKYCPNCGRRMVEPQESEDKE